MFIDNELIGSGQLPGWALGGAIQNLRNTMLAEVYVDEEKRQHAAYMNPLRAELAGMHRGEAKVAKKTLRVKPRGEVGKGAIERLKEMHAKKVQFRPLAQNYLVALAKADSEENGTAEVTAKSEKVSAAEKVGGLPDNV